MEPGTTYLGQNGPGCITKKWIQSLKSSRPEVLLSEVVQYHA